MCAPVERGTGGERLGRYLYEISKQLQDVRNVYRELGDEFGRMEHMRTRAADGVAIVCWGASIEQRTALIPGRAVSASYMSYL